MPIKATIPQLEQLEYSEDPRSTKILYRRMDDDIIRQTFKRAHRNQQIKDWVTAAIILAAMLLFVNIIWQA